MAETVLIEAGAVALFSALFRRLDANESIDIRAFSRGGTEARSFHTGLDQAASAAARAADRADVYFSVNPRADRDGTKRGVRHVVAIHAEFDSPEAPAANPPAREAWKIAKAAELRALTCPPSAIVDSGGGLHAYWLLDAPRPLPPPDDATRAAKVAEVEAVLKALVRHGGAGGESAEIARVLRVPATWNRKTKYPDGPLPVRLVELDAARRYAFETLAAAFPPVAAPAGRVNGTGTAHTWRAPADDERGAATVRNIAAAWPTDHGRHAFILAATGALARRGLSAARVSELLAAAAEQAGDRAFLAEPGGRGEIARAAEGAVARLDTTAEAPVAGFPALSEIAPTLALVLDALWPAPRIVFGTNGTEAESFGTSGTDSARGGVADPWPEPGDILSPGPAPRLPLERFPTEIRDSAEDAAERIRCPIDYPAWATLVSLAGLIGRGAGIRPRLYDDWTERLSFYVALIGSPSWMKSPALEFGTRPLRRQEAEDAAQHKRDVLKWQEDCKAIKAANADVGTDDLPPRPVQRRWTCEDVTLEKLADLLMPEVSRGVTIVRDELAGWIYDMNKYRAGSDRQFFLKANSGGPHPVDRVTRGSVIVPDLLLNIVGGIQPDVARQVFATGPVDGLEARMTAIWPDRAPTWESVDSHPSRAARDALAALCAQLVAADWPDLLTVDDYQPTPFCRPHPDGVRLFASWEKALMDSLHAGAYEARAEGRAGKYRGLAARLALLFHLVECASGRWPHWRMVATATIEDALAIMTEYVLPMDRRVFGEYAATAAAAGGRRIARWIQQDRAMRFTVRDVRRHHWSDLTEEHDVLKALDWLEVAGWVRPAERDRHRLGRPAVAFDVNPAVHGARS